MRKKFLCFRLVSVSKNCGFQSRLGGYISSGSKLLAYVSADR